MTLPLRDEDPIVAVATAPGRGAVGIVRMSGKGLMPLAKRLCAQAIEPRRAAYTAFLDEHGQALDRGLALFFPAPHSFTGEDVLELQAHGGPVLLQLLVKRCLQAAREPLAGEHGLPCLPRLRLAEPGEFTRRAFLNDKIDLAQAEAVADLIDASTEEAARSAARSLQGEFSRGIDELAAQLLRLRMLVEATLDFPEEDIDFLQQADALGQLQRLDATLVQVLAQTRQGVLLREGMTVVIAGQPNVGKSSLLNALAGAERSIVTPVAGTTRDRIEQALQIQGVPLNVIDTAGLRGPEQAQDEVERIGIDRSWQAICQADAVLLLRDLTRLGQPGYDQADEAIAAQLQGLGVPGERVMVVFNKADACREASAAGPMAGMAQGAESAPPLIISARTGQGLDALRQALLKRAGWQPQAEGVALARTRHLLALQRAAGHLAQGQALLQAPQAALELLAEELRLAHQALGEITGQLSADDLLGEIFAGFCIGK